MGSERESRTSPATMPDDRPRKQRQCSPPWARPAGATRCWRRRRSGGHRSWSAPATTAPNETRIALLIARSPRCWPAAPSRPAGSSVVRSRKDHAAGRRRAWSPTNRSAASAGRIPVATSAATRRRAGRWPGHRRAGWAHPPGDPRRCAARTRRPAARWKRPSAPTSDGSASTTAPSPRRSTRRSALGRSRSRSDIHLGAGTPTLDIGARARTCSPTSWPTSSSSAPGASVASLDRAGLIAKAGAPLRNIGPLIKRSVEYKAILDLLDRYHAENRRVWTAECARPTSCASTLEPILDQIAAACWSYLQEQGDDSDRTPHIRDIVNDRGPGRTRAR